MSARDERASRVAALRAAAWPALERGDRTAALACLRRALGESPIGRERQDVLVELGVLELPVDGRAAIRHLCEAYDGLTDPDERADLALVITRVMTLAAPPGAAAVFAHEAAAALPAERVGPRRSLLALAELAEHLHGVGQGPGRVALDGSEAPRGDAHDGDPREGDTRCGDGDRRRAAALAVRWMLQGTDRCAAVEQARFALWDDRLLGLGDPWLWALAVQVLIVAESEVGDPWGRARRCGAVAGDPLAEPALDLWEAFTLWRAGRPDDALPLVVHARAGCERRGSDDLGLLWAVGVEAGIHLDRGEVTAAERTIAAGPVGEAGGIGIAARLLRESRARLALATCRPDVALDLLGPDVEAAARGDPPGRIANPAWTPWRYPAARALAALDRPDEALALAEDQVRLLRRWGAPSALGHAQRFADQLLRADTTRPIPPGRDQTAGIT